MSSAEELLVHLVELAGDMAEVAAEGVGDGLCLKPSDVGSLGLSKVLVDVGHAVERVGDVLGRGVRHAGERHDSACGGGERADNFAETVAYGHVCRCDEVVFRPQLEKVAGFDYDDILRNFEVSVFGGTLGNGILVRPAFGAAPDGGENACTSQDSDIRLLHYLPFFS